MADFERQFANAIESAERAVFINLIRENPDLSLAAIAKLGKGRFEGLLGSVTVGDIVGANRLHEVRRGRGAGGGGGKDVNTRTRTGRDAYDEAVYDVVAGSKSPVRAPDVATKVGGTPLQVRAALTRLIEAGRVTWEGQARGTRYSLS